MAAVVNENNSILFSSENDEKQIIKEKRRKNSDRTIFVEPETKGSEAKRRKTNRR